MRECGEEREGIKQQPKKSVERKGEFFSATVQKIGIFVFVLAPLIRHSNQISTTAPAT